MGVMKVMAWLVGIVLAVLLVAAIAIPVLLPLETLVDELKHRVKRDTGYELAMQAPSVSVFPSLVIALEDISLAAPVAGAGPTMSIGQADLNIAWSSVWRGEIAVERFSLSDWVLDLRSPMATPAATDATAPGEGVNTGIPIPAAFDIALVDISMNRGKIVLAGSDNSVMQIEGIDVSLDMPSLDKTARVEGRLSLLGENMAGVLEIQGMRQFLAGDKAPLSLSFEGYDNRIAFKGVVETRLPRLQGELTLGQVDLLSLMPAADGGGGASASSHWSDEAIDLRSLLGPQLDVAISMEALRTPWIATGAMRAQLDLNDGQLQLTLHELAAYSGSGTGTLGLNAHNAALKAAVTMQDIMIQPLLNDAAGVDKLSGQGRVSVDIAGRMTSVKALVQSLSGKLGASLQDGAVIGFNLAAILKSAQQALQGNFAGVNLDKNFASAEKTDFSSLVAMFDVASGVMTARELAAQSPLLRVSGQGAIDLPQQTLDMLLTSRLVASAQGQGAVGDESGVAIPVAVKGPWADVKISPKLNKAAEEKAKAKVEEIKQSGKQKIEQELNKLLDKNAVDEDKKQRLKDLFSR
jgi:uncharacterized protein involved in outer membrane biogenesis